MTSKSSGKGDDEADTRKRVFVITPINVPGSVERQHADWVLNAAIRPVFEPRGYKVYRSDMIADPSMINDAIFNHIVDDEICIADLSFLNPNVFYELGVRHALSKPVIHIAHDLIKLPFDTAQHRAVFFTLNDWNSVESLKKQLGELLDVIEAPGFVVSNPLTHARGRQELANSVDAKDRVIADLMSRVETVESELRSSRSSGYVNSDKYYARQTANSVFSRAEKSLADSRNKDIEVSSALSSINLLQENQRALVIEHLATSITQWMVDRHGSPRDEIVADFPGHFGTTLSLLSLRDREKLHLSVMSASGADSMIDEKLLGRLLTTS